MTTELERLERANALIETIAVCGRKFFRHGEDVSRLEIDDRGRVWLWDKYSHTRVYTHSRYGKWRGFTEGGTLRQLIEYLRDYIKRDKDVPACIFGPWPKWRCDGDLWGYGRDMKTVRERAVGLGIVREVDDGRD